MGTEIPYQPIAIDQSDVRYEYGPDSFMRPDVQRGETVEFCWERSSVYAGTVRRFWVHVPARCDGSRPANLVVFQDGWWYLDPAGEVRAAVVLDNLVDRGEIPITIGVFVDPGVIPGAHEAKHRNVEYDAFDERYVTFLLDEILPQVSARWPLSAAPEDRLICGGSSGGNCAFTAAWLRPDAFGHLISFLASFAQMPGGDPYPDLIAATARKPLKVLMQAGHRDIGYDQPQHNWLAENLRVAAALAERGYEHRLILGDGGHNPHPDPRLTWLQTPARVAERAPAGAGIG